MCIYIYRILFVLLVHSLEQSKKSENKNGKEIENQFKQMSFMSSDNSSLPDKSSLPKFSVYLLKKEILQVNMVNSL